MGMADGVGMADGKGMADGTAISKTAFEGGNYDIRVKTN